MLPKIKEAIRSGPLTPISESLAVFSYEYVSPKSEATRKETASIDGFVYLKPLNMPQKMFLWLDFGVYMAHKKQVTKLVPMTVSGGGGKKKDPLVIETSTEDSEYKSWKAAKPKLSTNEVINIMRDYRMANLFGGILTTI